MDTKPHLDPKSEFKSEYISILEDHIEKGIRLLSTLTSEKIKEHPLLISRLERFERLEYFYNKSADYKIQSIEHYHRAALKNDKQLGQIKRKIDTWSEVSATLLKNNYPDIYLEQFIKSGNIDGLSPDASSNANDRLELLAEKQIKLKTRLENMVYFLERRVAYFDEFKNIPECSLLGILVDDYSRRFIGVLNKSKLFCSSDIYPAYFDPLFMMLPDNKSIKLESGRDNDAKYIINIIRHQITKPAFCYAGFGFSLSIDPYANLPEHVWKKLSKVENEIEADYEASIGKSFPNEIKSSWEIGFKSLYGAVQLLSRINYLPVYLRDEMKNENRKKIKRESKIKCREHNPVRNTQIREEIDKLLKQGMTVRKSVKILAKKNNLSESQIYRIVGN